MSLKEMVDFLREDKRELRAGREGVVAEISAIIREGHLSVMCLGNLSSRT
jgi:hypothetical protein